VIRTIVIHCSASPHGRGDNAETIHRWHLDNGWSGIGYHWVILEDGTAQAGRPEYWTGAHVRGHNTGSIGICLIGDYSFTEDQMSTLVGMVRIFKAKYSGVEIMGHYQLDNNKTCPNFDVPLWLQDNGLNS